MFKLPAFCTFVLAVLAAAFTAASARASFTLFTSEADYLLGYETAYFTENFDTAGASTPSATYSSGGLGFTVSAPGNVYRPAGFISTINRLSSLTFSPSSNVEGIGGYFFVVNDSNQFTAAPIYLTLTDIDGATYALSYTPTSTTDFRGIISTRPVASLVVRKSDPNTVSRYIAADHVTVVPEPGTVALIGLGALALLLRRRFIRSS